MADRSIVKKLFITMYELLDRNDLVPDGAQEVYQSLLNSEQNDAVSDTSKDEATTSSDNQTSQIADKDEKEELSRLKEENERLRASYYKLWKKTSPPPNESPDK